MQAFLSKIAGGIKLLRKIFLTLLILLCFSVSTLGMFYDWQEFSTENFNVYYKKETETIAFQAAGIAEEVHQELTAYLNFTPNQKTNLILYDDRDIVSGWAQLNLWGRTIGIYTAHPNYLLEVAPTYQSWLRLLIAHEYAHILQLSLMPENLWPWGWLNYLFPPYLLQPYWFIEGFAIMAETNLTNSGRGDSFIIDAMLQAAADEGTLLSYDQIKGFYDLSIWPHNRAPYNYGVLFLQYLEQEYGAGFAGKWAQQYTENPLRGLDSWFNYLTDDDIDEVYQKWIEQYQPQTTTSLPGSKISSFNGFNTGSAISPSGREIAYFHQLEGLPTLKLWSSAGVKNLSLASGIYGGRPAWSVDGNYLAYARLEPQGNKGYYHQIFIYDLRQQDEVQLTSGWGGSHPTWSSRGDIAYLERTVAGKQVVSVLPGGEEKKVILENRSNWHFKSLAYDYTGRYLAIETWLEGGYQGIYIWNRENEKLEALFLEEGPLENPYWSKDGTYLYFILTTAESRDIYAYHLADETFFRVTESPYGIYDFSTTDQRKAYTALSNEGFVVYYAPLRPSLFEEIELVKTDPVPVEDAPEFELSSAPRNYSLWRNTVPQIVMPTALDLGSSIAWGAFLAGRDPLGLLSYELQLLSDFDGRSVIGLNTTLYPDLGDFRELYFRFDKNYYADEGFIGGRVLTDLVFEQSMLARQGFIIGGSLYFGDDSAYTGLDLGYYQQSLGGTDRSKLRSSYLGLIGFSLSPQGAQLGIEGRTKQFLELTPQTVLGLDFKVGMANVVDPDLPPFVAGPTQSKVSVRGFAEPFYGTLISGTSLQLQQSIFKIERGWGPLFAKDLWVAPFFEFAIAHQDRVEGGAALGLELGLDLSVLYGRFPLNLIVGGAINNQQGRELYFRVSATSFLEGLGFDNFK